ncbi:hypothetical protein ACSBR1_040194 [Camellia fascicularis]
MAPSRLLTLFFDLNDSSIKIANTNSSKPRQNAHAPISVFSLLVLSVEQLMVAQSDIEVNSYTLKSCVETMTTVSNLSLRLHSRTNEVHQLNAQLYLFQGMYQDARKEISQLKKQNIELKRQATSIARFGAHWCSLFDEQ